MLCRFNASHCFKNAFKIDFEGMVYIGDTYEGENELQGILEGVHSEMIQKSKTV